MRQFEWDREYDVGHEKLNEEHRELLNFINKIFMESESCAEKTTLIDLLEKLESMIHQHLKEEQDYMCEKSLGDHALLGARPVDQDMLTQLRKYKASLSKWDGELNEDFFSFLKVWMLGHTLFLNKQSALAKKAGKDTKAIHN